MPITSEHPLYYNCPHSEGIERYGLLRQKDNCFYAIDNNFEVLKTVQLLMMRYEMLSIVNIDHFFTFLPKTQIIIDKYQIDALTNNHNAHVAQAAIINNNEERIQKIQKEINNNNCFLFGLTQSTARNLYVDINHFRLQDNIIQLTEKPKTFNEDVQEKLFLLRRIVYVLNALQTYLLEFARLQERISTDGLIAYKDYFKLCYPLDTKFEKIIEKDLAIERQRPATIKLYINTVYKKINQIDLGKSIKELIVEMIADTSWIAEETLIDHLDHIPAYEAGRISKILHKDLTSILKILK